MKSDHLWQKMQAATKTQAQSGGWDFDKSTETQAGKHNSCHLKSLLLTSNRFSQ